MKKSQVFGRGKANLLILAGLVALLATAWFISAQLSRKPVFPTAAQPAVAEISISDQGFSPTDITVKHGTLVTWTNTDTEPHQVAADPHPAHSSIPGFDSDQLLQTGDSYSFTFEKPGRYTYHDHLRPYEVLGKVTVE